MVVGNTCEDITVDVEMSVEMKKKKNKWAKKKNKAILQQEMTDVINDTTVVKCNKMNVKLQPVMTKDSSADITTVDVEMAVEMKKKKKKRDKKKNEATLQQEMTDVINDTTVVKCNKINVKLQPVMTKDSRHIICPCGNTIAVFRRKTGLLENLFSEHEYDVSNIYINHQDPTQIISCSPRELLVWDFEDLSLFKKYDIPFKAISWYLNPRCYEEVYFTRVRKEGEKKESAKKAEQSVKIRTELVKWNVAISTNLTVLGSVSKCVKCVVVSRTGDYVVFSYKNKLFIHRNSDNTKKSFEFDGTHITCIALHPTEFVVATGDKKGKLVLWYNLFSDEEQICTELHWHNLDVADLVFTKDGNYLMSGGKEGVLVMWQLETHEKSFIPRIGGAINHLVQSDDEQYYCISLDNNVLKIVSSVDSRVKKTIKYLAPAYELPAGLSYHSPSDCLVLNGKPDGVLQFYQPEDDLLKLSIDIIGENRVSNAEGRYVYPTRVKQVAFSQDGTWMVTVDEREDRILPTERKLKFWKYSLENKNYSLNTLVDPPHKAAISCLLFRPAEDLQEYTDMVVTTSDDGDIKTWIVNKETDENGVTLESWQIHSVGSYGINCCKYASFSQDGSLLAVAFSSVTLWDPDDLSFRRCLQYNAKDDEIMYIAFGYHESSHCLIGHSANYLIVWDVKDINACTVLWILEAKVSLLKCDPYSKYCVVFVKPGDGIMTDLYLFEPASPPPTTSYHHVNQGHGEISSVLFLPKNCQSSNGTSICDQTGQLYILTEKTDILSLRREADGEKIKKYDKSITVGEEKSVFKDLFGSILDDVTAGESEDEVGGGEQGVIHGTPSSVVIRKMVTTPTNVLPSAQVMCKAYVKSLLIPSTFAGGDELTAMEAEELELEAGDVITDLDTYVTTVDNNSSDITEPVGNDIYMAPKELLDKMQNLNFEFVIDALK